MLHALSSNDWPTPPRWLTTLHNAFHSLPVALVGAVVVRGISGRWPRRELVAWTLHILVDIPTHSREPWGPRFLWIDGLVGVVRQVDNISQEQGVTLPVNAMRSQRKNIR